MRLKGIKITLENRKILSKLLGDAIFLTLVFFAAALLGEAVLPGIITAHIGFTKIILALFFEVLLLGYFAKVPEVAEESFSINKKSALALTLFSLVPVSLGLIRFGVFFGLVILAAGGLVVFLLYRLIFQDRPVR